MYLNVILTIFVIVQVTIVYLAYRFWKKYGKNMYNAFISMKNTVPNQMFGGGNANPSGAWTGSNGTTNTGGGGGGSADNSNSASNGGSGGSGIVIIRYLS